MVIAIAFTLMAVFFLAGLYVAGALGSLALLLMEIFSENPLSNIMANRAWDTYTRFLLVAIPLFILMGELVLRSGIADRMYRALDRWVAHAVRLLCYLCQGDLITCTPDCCNVLYKFS